MRIGCIILLIAVALPLHMLVGCKPNSATTQPSTNVISVAKQVDQALVTGAQAYINLMPPGLNRDKWQAALNQTTTDSNLGWLIVDLAAAVSGN